MAPSNISSSSTPTPTTNRRTLRILMLHGYTQSGPLFRAKTRALEKSLNKHLPNTSIHLVYPSAPIRIPPSDQPGGVVDSEPGREEAYGWWRRRKDRSPVSNTDGGGGEGYGYTYEGIYEGLGRIAETLKAEGPFDGVVGFSQGGACAGMVAALLEPDRRDVFRERESEGGMAWPESFSSSTSPAAIASSEGQSEENGAIQPPLKFAASYSGFAPQPLPALYHAFYEPMIMTPMLHFLGEVDTVVEESRSMALVDACVNPTVVRHPGGHFLPASSRECVAALVTLIKQTTGWDGEGNAKAVNIGTGGRPEPRVEDMEVPF